LQKAFFKHALAKFFHVNFDIPDIIAVVFFFVKSLIGLPSPVLACFCYKTAKKPEIIVAYLPVYDKMKIGYTYYYVCSFHKDDLFNRRII